MSGLAMSNEEICVRYRQAKNKGEQVQILAELNDCPIERIIGILVASGEDNRKFNHLRGQLKKAHNYTPNISQEDKQKIFEESLEQQRKQEQQVKIPYKKPEVIPAPPKKADIPAPVIAAVEDKITELQYMINQNKDQVKSLLQHNEKFRDRIGILTAWLEEVSKNESTEN